MKRNIRKRLAAICILAAVLVLAASLTHGGCRENETKDALKMLALLAPPPTRPDVGGTVYNAAASVGHNLTCQLNTSTLEFSYLIIEDWFAFGLQCNIYVEPGFGNNVYDASGDPIVLLPDALILHRISWYGSAGEPALTAGVPELTSNYNASEIEGMYNFVRTGIDEGTGEPAMEYGTFEIVSDGTWRAWPLRDGATTPTASDDPYGTWVDRGNGIVDIYLETGIIGLVRTGGFMVYPSANGNIIVMEMNLSLPGVIELKGMMLGITQQSIAPGSVDGIYDALDTETDVVYAVDLAGTILTTPGGPVTISYDAPWTGMISDGSEFYGMLSPDGIFFAVNIPVGAGETDVAIAAIKE